MGLDFFFISLTSSNVFGRGNPTVSGSTRVQRPPTIPNAPNKIIGSFSSTAPIVTKYFPLMQDRLFLIFY